MSDEPKQESITREDILHSSRVNFFFRMRDGVERDEGARAQADNPRRVWHALRAEVCVPNHYFTQSFDLNIRR